MNLDKIISKKTLFEVGAAVVIVYLIIHYWSIAAHLLSNLWKAVLPLLIGAVIAYLLNILMSFYERHYLFGEKSRRAVCLIGAILTILAIVALIIGLVVPQLTKCITQLVKSAPAALEKLFTNEKLLRLLPKQALDWVTNIDAKINQVDWGALIQKAFNWFKGGATGEKLTNFLSNTISWVGSVGIGIIFAIYYLSSREKILSYMNRILRRYLKASLLDRLFYYGHNLNETFHKYIVAECMAAIILGVLCFFPMLMLRIPYAGMLAVLIAIMELIPYVGIALSTVVGFIMILSESPAKAVIFVVLVIVIKTLDSNLIYPRVVGSSIGVPGIVVFAGITVGGSLFGLMGILFSIPFATALYTELKRRLDEGSQPAHVGFYNRLFASDNTAKLSDQVDRIVRSSALEDAVEEAGAPSDTVENAPADNG